MAAPTRNPIQILPENVVHKIAAGEVVERPASVVKELVENSLDAGAKKIHVSVEKGGMENITVTDDGHGISPQELHLALKRHATSKISGAEDLFSLHTLGFRGEALPSIASVSEFRIESATERSDPVGYFLEVYEGRVTDLQETPMTRGTRVRVNNLFCTTPARQKFLKRPETEWSHIADLLTAMALGRLEVEWQLEQNGKKYLFCPPTREPQQRILDLFGKEAMENLFPMERRVSGIHLHGLLGHPNFSKKTNRRLFVFVNGRYVQDRLINHAIVSGYRGLLMTQQYPMVILYLEIDGGQVDVNVHPTKREVRFANSNALHNLISETIRLALDAAPWRSTQLGQTQGGGRTHRSAPTEDIITRRGGPMCPPSSGQLPRPLPVAGFDVDYRQRVQAALEDFAVRNRAPIENFVPPQARIGTVSFGELQLIGQFDLTYLICQHEGSLILIDQHAAHERIGYEQLKRSYQSGSIPHQKLLQPIPFDVPFQEFERLREILPELESLGFAVEEFGENSFVIKAHPTLLDNCDWLRLVRELADGPEGKVDPLQDKIEHRLATMACHRQVRAKDRLNHEEMLELLKQLEGTPRSYHCPHGRPVMVEVESREIEKWFKRVL